ncbi:hypothetical protein KP509_33G040900 [Ceratopteris richardii]|uniref:Uncharacterized protein n=1 Tax=Ceratopteris richardii TaxID=49495 RepID=A0A8T2QQ18_CERRI|nr:hypothetical protein KP509_33G040900 [Ceratopteris richardii]
MASAGDEKQTLGTSGDKGVETGSNADEIFQVNTGPSKSWPELVGLPGEEAKCKILAEDPNLTVVILPEGSFVTMDFRTDRVRIFVDDKGIVTKTPHIG